MQRKFQGITYLKAIRNVMFNFEDWSPFQQREQL